MASSIAAQLSQIAASSTNSLNLKAQKASHAKSLIFEPRVAVSQSFDSLYTLCHEGFQELCLLDSRFVDFQRSIFSEQSKEQDRTQMTTKENAELDKRLEDFLGLVGGRLRLNPAIKSVEWLIRRFRIHEHNTAFLLTTFLPYHTLPMFTTLLSILPPKLPLPYNFLRPYIRSLMAPPRHTVVLTATNDTGFSSLLNEYVLKISNARQSYPALLSFWAGIMTEAVSAMLNKSKSGRQGVEMEKEQQVVLRLIPFLNEGLALKKAPELRIGCYMLLSVMASKGGLNDKLLTAMMDAVALGWTRDTFMPGLVCLSILAQHRGAKQLTRRLTKELLNISGLSDILLEVSQQRRIDKLASGLCLALIDRLSKKGDANMLPLVEFIVIHELVLNSQSVVIIKAMLLLAYKLDDNADTQRSVRNELSRTLTTMAKSSGRVGTIAQNAMVDSSIDMDELEMKLHTTIRPMSLPSVNAASLTVKDAEVSSLQESQKFSDMLAHLPTRTMNEGSFLSHDKSLLYGQLCDAFLNSINDEENIAKFANAPILQRDVAAQKPFYFSFCIRVFCGPSPVLVRAAALKMIAESLHQMESSAVDFQAIIPYVVVALVDPALRVRQAAANLATALDRLYPIDEDLKKKKKAQSVTWAATEIYGSRSTQAIWLSSDQAARVLRDTVIPALEECILDKNHVSVVLERILNSSSKTSDTPKKMESARWSQVLRAAVLSFLASHAVITPIYTTKLRLLASLNQVRGVASLSRTKTLLPILQSWAALSSKDIQSICDEEQMDATEFDGAAVHTVVGTDADGLDCLTNIIKAPASSDRPSFVSAVLRRLREMWPSLKGETRVNIAHLLMEVGLWPAGESGPSAETQGETMELLRTVDLSTDILLSFLNQLPTATKLTGSPPTPKRRRISHGEAARASVKDPKEMTEAIRKTTSVLQLIESSRPQNHPQLLKGLFNTLAELQHFKTQIGSEFGYLQCLILESSLAIMKKYKSDRALKLDSSAVRADLLVDCVQKTSSPQVQNAALLLIASLADIAPELVLHSVMPIFTFMGTSTLRQNDEYSAHVIKQTITEVIPPLIASLRKGKVDPVTGAAEVLLSFVAAYEHVTSHRRKGLFSLLVQTLGAEEFLFALLAMLINKYGATESTKAFTADLCGSFSINVQLQTSAKYLDLVSDVLGPKPTISVLLLQYGDLEGTNSRQIALTQLALLPYLLSRPSLVQQTSKQLQCDDMNASRIRELYSSVLEKILELIGKNKSDKPLGEAYGNVLESVLGLLSASEFVKSVEKLLETPNNELRRKILKCLLARIEKESQSNAASRFAMLNFLPHLTVIIRESDDFFCKHIAVACVDKIAEKYGKKDLEAVAAAAETIAGDNCLGQSDQRLEIISLLCLASLVEILREGIVSVLPKAIPKALEYIRKGLERDNRNAELHSAGYSFISALLEHLPYMISGQFLDKLLSISSDSAESGIDEETTDARLQCLELSAKRIESKIMLGALRGNWLYAVRAGTRAVREFISVLSTVIEVYPKSTVAKHIPVLSSILMDAFDLQRQWSLNSAKTIATTEMTAIEGLVNDVAIKMIYKLNDSTFRPFFAGLVEWAANTLPKKDKRGRVLRLQSLYSFTAVLFTSLKSIVTNYATYILDISVEILQSTDVTDDDSKELWKRVLISLVECFKYDQDDFWQSPSHFDVIQTALTSQILNASSLPLEEELLPAIVELAAAADSADHHKKLSGTILKLMRSDSAAVRLVAVKCEQALTDRLGEEWLSLLPEMLPFISELQEDDDEVVERETHRLIVKIEAVLGESLDSMLQ